VREPGGQLAERDHLLVVQAARREDPGAIEHLVYEDRRHRVTRADHRGKVVAMDGQDRRGPLRDRVAGRSDKARVREQARDVAVTPLHHLVAAGAAIDKDGEVP